MAARALITALQGYLSGAPDLAPSPATIGVVEPRQNTDLPAVVMALDELVAPAPGLGERATVVRDGALPWQSIIELDDPVLPGAEPLQLLSPDRRVLTLPHGGLVDRAGQPGTLDGSSLAVRLDGVSLTVVPGTPAAGEVQAQGAVGLLTFGSALPATGTLSVDYFIGQWERRVARLAGSLQVDVTATSGPDCRDLGDTLVGALQRAPASVTGLHELSMSALGAVGLAQVNGSDASHRQQRWRFDFEHIVDQPESSGGVIQRIRLRSRADDAPLEQENIE